MLIQAVVGIIKRDNKLLIAQRPIGKPYSGYWEFPGGKIERNESAESALKRELYEELAIEVTNADFWFEHQHSYPDKTVLLSLWFVKQFAGQPQAQEQQVLRWVTVEEMLELRLLEGNWFIRDKLASIG